MLIVYVYIFQFRRRSLAMEGCKSIILTRIWTQFCDRHYQTISDSCLSHWGFVYYTLRHFCYLLPVPKKNFTSMLEPPEASKDYYTRSRSMGVGFCILNPKALWIELWLPLEFGEENCLNLRYICFSFCSVARIALYLCYLYHKKVVPGVCY